MTPHPDAWSDLQAGFLIGRAMRLGPDVGRTALRSIARRLLEACGEGGTPRRDDIRDGLGRHERDRRKVQVETEHCRRYDDAPKTLVPMGWCCARWPGCGHTEGRADV